MFGGTTTQNVQGSPWLISYYTFDHAGDTATIVTDCKSAYDAAVPGGTMVLSEDAPGGGTGAAVAAPDADSTILIQMYNIGELRNYQVVAGNAFGEAFAWDTTWSCNFVASPDGGLFERIWDEAEGNAIRLENPVQVNSLTLKVTCIDGSTTKGVLPIVTHPGTINLRISVTYETL